MRLIAAALLAVMATQASAQDHGWSFKITPYLWLPDSKVKIDTPRGTASAELPIDKALEALDFGYMGAIEANNGKWSILNDILYFDLTQSQPTPFGTLFGEARVASQITAVSVLAAYRVHETRDVSIDVGAGARAWWVDSKVSLTAGTLPAESFSSRDNWIDPIVAVRGRMNFDEKWFGTFYLDAGGFGVGSEQSYQFLAGVGYNMNEKWALQGGWRYLDFKRKENGNTLDMSQSGLVIGATYRF